MAAARRGEIRLDSKSVRWLAVGGAFILGLLLVACSAGAAQSRAAAPSVTTGAAAAIHGTIGSAASASSPPSTAGPGASNEGSGGSKIENQPSVGTEPPAHVASSQIANQSSLAFTGSRNETMTIAGLVLVASGVSLVLAARRRRA